MVLPLAIVAVIIIVFMSYFIYQLTDKMKTTLYDRVYISDQNILNADRDLHQALLAILYQKESSLVNNGVDYATDFKDNVTQVEERVNAGVDNLMIDEEVGSLTPSDMFSNLYKSGTDDPEGYLAEKRTLNQIRQEFLKEFAEWKTKSLAEAIAGFDSVRSHLDAMSSYTDLYATYALGKINSGVGGAVNTLIMICFLVVAVINTFALLVERYIRKSLRKAIDGVENLSRNDLVSVPEVVDGKDDICELTRATKVLFDNMSKVIGKINDSANELHGAAERMNASSQEVSTSTEQIVEAVTQTAENITGQANDTESAAVQVHALEDIVEKSSQSAENLAEASKTIQVATTEGMNVVNELERTTMQSNQAFESIFTVIEAMNISVGKIGEASNLISGIASQTNLLSLNASIEAARAGEAGKGFAVVADEIRQLADQSASAVSTIDSMLSELTENAGKAEEESTLVRKMVQLQDQSVGQTKEKYMAIVNTIESIDKEIHSLDEISTQMDESCKTVVDLIANLSAGAEENAATTEETSASSTYILESMKVIADVSMKVNSMTTDLKEILSLFSFVA